MKRLDLFSLFKFLSIVAAGGLLWTVSGCARPGKVERELVSQITQKCGNRGSCRLQIDQLASFDWDRLYAFKYTATEQDRERALGTKDVGYRDLERQLVFLKDGKIVHQESESTNVEHPVKNEVVFDIPDAVAFKSYPRGTVFSINQLNGSSGPYYELSEVR
jgi:hypothetical protein